MKIIVAGPRDYFNSPFVVKAIEDSGFQISELVCGMAHGVDHIALEWAKRNDLPIEEFPPDYDNNPPKAAPLMRNIEMAKYADGAVIIWDGKSRGTRHMLGEAFKHGIPIYLVRIDR